MLKKIEKIRGSWENSVKSALVNVHSRIGHEGPEGE
jgi:hypothetical protein